MNKPKVILCDCGCEQEVKPGNRYILGHNLKGNKHTKGHSLTEEHKNKISKSMVGKNTGVPGNNKGCTWKQTEEARKKMIGNKNSLGHKNNFKDGRETILDAHRALKKGHCEEHGNSCLKPLRIHHEPPIDYGNILNWEGRLITSCKSAHMRRHRGTFIFQEKAGIIWTKEDTQKLLEEQP